ncbi:MAG TPA: tetratricopeptide repeat protein, partial [Acidimicrobiales bacterium]|nr:tetratricopeptide repeat protein [Acidimicrobiales bacterium]
MDEAIELLTDTFERGKKHAPTEDHPTWLSGHLLAFTHTEAGHLEEAVVLGREVLAARRGLHGPDHVFTLMTACCLGANLRDTQHMSEAIALLTDALRRGQRNAPDKDWPTWSTGYELTLTLAVAGRLSEAAEVGAEVFAARRRLFGPDDMGTVGAAWNLAAILRQTGRFDAAIELLAGTYDRARRSASGGQEPILTLGYGLAATLA